jgi:hypothetical protein
MTLPDDLPPETGLGVAVFEERERVANAEGFGEGEEDRRVNALDGGTVQHTMGAGLRDARQLRQRVGRRDAMPRHMGFNLPIDHRYTVYAYYSRLTSTQRTLSILPYTNGARQ